MKIILIVLSGLFLVSCAVPQDCPENINKLPMYGRVQKCKEQIEFDSTFLKSCDKNFKTRLEASKYYTKRGWDYYYQSKSDTAMMRFNQAWLLDSLNADTYWGFAILVGTQKKFQESLPLFNRSIRINPTNSKVWESAANSYGQVFVQNNDGKYLDSTITYLKKAIYLEPNSPRIYSQITAAYTYYMQKDSAKKYLKITDDLDKAAINPEVRKLLEKN